MAYKSQFHEDVLSNSSLIRNCHMLVIDPSSGSKSSMPGFAYFVNGDCAECGIIDLDHRQPLQKKLSQLGRILRENFSVLDVLIVEQIAPFMSSAGTDFKNKAVVNLHKSIGAVFASLDPQLTLEIPIPTWKAWLRKKGVAESYEKSDSNDALVMGLVVLEIAGTPIDWNRYFQKENA